MKINKTNKTLSKFILAGLLISSLPVPLAAKPVKAPVKISKQEIEQKIAHLQKTVKKLKKLRRTLAITIGGVGGAVFVAFIALTVGAGIATAGTSTLAQASGFAAFIPSMFGMMFIMGWVGGGATLLGTLAAVPLSIAGLSAAVVLKANKGAKKLEKIEKQQPGTLDRKQKIVVAQFKNLMKGPLLKGMLKGFQLKKTLEKLVAKTIKANPIFVTSLGKNKAKKTIKKYIMMSWQLRNARAAKKEYDEKIKNRKITRNAFSVLSIPYHTANAKIIAMKTGPKRIMMKSRIRKLKRRIKRVKKKLSGHEHKLQAVVKQFMQDADDVVKGFKKPTV